MKHRPKGLSAQFAAAGLRLGRLKTGTPPRIEARSIDFGRTQVQPGSRVPLWFSFEPPAARDVAGGDAGGRGSRRS